MTRLILASTSPYRKALLERLGLTFETRAPDIDESAKENESPQQLVSRLAEQKARAVAEDTPDSLIIGSDQVAVLENQILGKPGTHLDAFEQLQRCSGKRVDFYTGLCVHDSSQGTTTTSVIPYSVYFRNLSEQEIENYLKREQPYDCAGSFKSEGLGIALFERMEGNDPNALIGLPLIELCKLLQKNGINVLGTEEAQPDNQ